MTRIEFPRQLKELLEESELQSPIRGLADRVGEIVSDNKLPFFPDYTDHGIDHITCVLKTEVGLVPKQVWEKSKKDSDPRLLCDADAAVIIGGTLLHDIAMHLRPVGFLELISKDSRFQPLPWFKDGHDDHTADRPWHELWEKYVREAKRFSERDLADIIGEESARKWKFQDLATDTGLWETNQCLIIGEFIRRHHARLAHEIAIYGFPGLEVGSGERQFPAMGSNGHTLMRLADLIGLTARSHGMSLRVCGSYLDTSPVYGRNPRPMGTAVLYPMALLRVADYFQINRKRAPAVLLQLRNSQSPISVQEWKKHQAVLSIGPATDPRGKMVTVSKDLSLSTYLQLRDLLSGLQSEMDHSTAVLDEAYGNFTGLGLNELGLAIRRVHSNLQSPAFRESLPYVPNRAGFNADPNLLTLLVEPLYGKRPGVGVRELMQNAVDAVCELEAWCAARGKQMESLDLPKQDGDVLIEFVRRDDDSWYIRVQDRGIGMSSDTIENYYLRAGASFRRSPEWGKEFLDENGKPRVLRAGRFGIGAFAVFLLGPSFRLWTRHASVSKAQGYSIEASANSQLIEISRVEGLPVGTTVEVDLSAEAIEGLELEEKRYKKFSGPMRLVDWFFWDWPKVVELVRRNGKSELLKQEFSWPVRKGKLPPEWSVIHPVGFDSVFWNFNRTYGFPELVCNGIRIGSPDPFDDDVDYNWPTSDLQLYQPTLSVIDSVGNLPLTTQRYELSDFSVPFIDELSRDVLLSVIAHALVRGPSSRLESLSAEGGHPLRVEQFAQYGNARKFLNLKDDDEDPFAYGRLRWCSTSGFIVPADPWCYTLLNSDSCIVYGAMEFGKEVLDQPCVWEKIVSNLEKSSCSLLHWNSNFLDEDREAWRMEEAAGIPARILGNLAAKGIGALGHKAKASQLLASTTDCHLFEGSPELLRASFHGKTQSICKEHAKRRDRTRFRADKGTLTTSVSLETMIEILEMAEGYRDSVVLFVAEIKTRKVRRSPESLLAKLWKECLGERAIPFDPESRSALIADAEKHPELKRHIDAWRKMKPRAEG